MDTHPARLTQIITGMVPAFAGLTRPREEQVAEAVELVLATNPTLEELADARQAVLDNHQEAIDYVGYLGSRLPEEGREWMLQNRSKQADALAIAETRLRDTRE